ncbi:MAG: hypothetical protein WDA74_10895 [Spirochaetota bacterium]
MKKTIFTVVILLFFSVSNALAFDWASRGLSLIDSGSVDEENFIILEDSSSVEVKIRFRNELGANQAEKTADLFSDFKSWKYLTMSRVEFFWVNDTCEILIIPAAYEYKDMEYTPYIPGGLVFIYDDYLRYNFRVNKDNFFLRINDRFINEEILSGRIKEAVEDPVAYLTKREPEYFLQKLTKLEERQERIAGALLYFQNSGFLGFGNTPVKKSLIKRIIEIKTEEPDIKADAIKARLADEKIEASNKEIKLILNIFYNEF